MMAQDEMNILGYTIPDNWLHHYISLLHHPPHHHHPSFLPPPQAPPDDFTLGMTLPHPREAAARYDGEDWPIVRGVASYMGLEEAPKLEDFLGGMRFPPLDHGVPKPIECCVDDSSSGHGPGKEARRKRAASPDVGGGGVGSEVKVGAPSSVPPQRTSSYRGVTRHRWTGRYEAHLWDNSCVREGQKRKGRQVYLGGYDKEERAARAYDLASLKYWGTTASTNFPVAIYAKELEEMKDLSKQEFIASLRRNSSGFSRGASIYRGVTRHHQHGRWQARIGRVAGNKDLYLGTFTTEQEAAEAYDIAAIKFRGANAVTNFELSRYDLEAIACCDLPIGSSARRLRFSQNAEGQSIAGCSPQLSCLPCIASDAMAVTGQGWDWLSISSQHECKVKCSGTMGEGGMLQLTVASGNE